MLTEQLVSLIDKLDVPRNLGRPSTELTLGLIDLHLHVLGSSYHLLRSFLEAAPPRLTDGLSHARAMRAARWAAARVPAYRTYLQGRGIDIMQVRSLDELPEIDKQTYVNVYPLEQRCLGGHIPLVGTTMDESSGSTGRPYNWLRAGGERAHVRRMVSFFARYAFGDAPLVILNAFSMGAWATGFTMAIALEPNGLVKATGPDVQKILATMKELGPGYRYLIAGYPPFLKLLLDQGDAAEFPWAHYEMHALMGGDGNSEGLRDYLQRRFRSVYSGYGATDVEIGLAAETAVSVRLRRLAAEDSRLALTLFGESRRSPMVFQYNPLLHFIETNANGELVFTVNRLSTLTPKIRYNIHDEGGVIRHDVLLERLQSAGYRWKDVMPALARRPIQAPYLYIFGRKDFTISVMGCNIYPQDIEAAIYSVPDVAVHVRSFLLSVIESIPGETRPLVSIQLEAAEPNPYLEDRVATVIWSWLLERNHDFQEAVREYPELMRPVVQLHRTGTGPFVGSEQRIKHQYLVT
ncbi:MAG: phenylacetate--CoA ligase family protein [Chloroflexota bacterium]